MKPLWNRPHGHPLNTFIYPQCPLPAGHQLEDLWHRAVAQQQKANAINQQIARARPALEAAHRQYWQARRAQDDQSDPAAYRARLEAAHTALVEAQQAMQTLEDQAKPIQARAVALENEFDRYWSGWQPWHRPAA